jgi:hypothetical protein
MNTPVSSTCSQIYDLPALPAIFPFPWHQTNTEFSKHKLETPTRNILHPILSSESSWGKKVKPSRGQVRKKRSI